MKNSSKIEIKEAKVEEPKKEIVESKPVSNLKGKKSKKEPRVKQEKVEKEKEKEKEKKKNQTKKMKN